jgi:hypothetical protein
MLSSVDYFMSSVNAVAIIGSFKNHYEYVCDVWRAFSCIGLIVTSPKGESIIEERVPFVRFVSDPQSWANTMIQTVALHRILRADFVYVAAPRGYVGRTTCYEIGRVIQAKRPLYFSECPVDLPITIPETHIYAPNVICDLIRNSQFQPIPLYLTADTRQLEFERDLINCHFRSDDEIE